MSAFESTYEAEPEKQPVEAVISTHESDPPSKEALEAAEQTLAQTLELESVDLNDFPTILRSRVKTLPSYQAVERSLEEVSAQTVPRKIFEALRDVESNADAQSKDGVLIRSMREGSLNCAGRVMIGSALLKEQGINHWIVSTIAGEGGHSVLMIEEDSNTYAYCDAQNGLYFTFPKEALSGDPSDSVARCTLKEFVPREKDISMGLSSISRTFVTAHPDIGTAAQYLDNMQAALNGNQEFENSGIVQSAQGAEAIPELKRQVLGNEAIRLERASENFYNKGILDLSEKNKEYKILLTDVFQAVKGDKKMFCDQCVPLFENHPVIRELFPYLQHATKEKRREAAEKIWQFAKQSL